MALLETLTEDFSAGSVDTTKWPTRAGFTQTGGVGQLAVPASAGAESSFKSAFSYDLRGSQLLWKVAQFPTAGNWRVFVRIYIASGNFNDYLTIEWSSTSNQLSWREQTSANGVRISGVATLDTSTQVWGRIRESGGTITFETSADGSSWTSRGSGSSTITLSGAAQQAAFHYVWTAAQATGPTGVTQYDNINVTPAVDLAGTTAGTSSMTGTLAGVPAAPAAPTVTPGDGSGIVAFSAPADGGSAILDYEALAELVPVSDQLAGGTSGSGSATGNLRVTHSLAGTSAGTSGMVGRVFQPRTALPSVSVGRLVKKSTAAGKQVRVTRVAVVQSERNTGVTVAPGKPVRTTFVTER